MKINKIKSNAKLNLALNITGKKKFLHKIESIIGFIDLHDVFQSINIMEKNIIFLFMESFLKILEKKILFKNYFKY